MLSCDTHFLMCNIELCEGGRVSTDIADNWKHMVVNVQTQRMVFENAVTASESITHLAMWDH